MNRRTASEILALLNTDNPLNVARKIMIYRPVTSDPIETRRIEFETVEKIAAALAAPRKPVMWQYRVMYDLHSTHQTEWCHWHDCSEEYYGKLCADIEAGKGRLQVRELFE